MLNKKRCPRHQALYTMASLAAFINKPKGLFFFFKEAPLSCLLEEGSCAGSAETEGGTRRAQVGCQGADKV